MNESTIVLLGREFFQTTLQVSGPLLAIAVIAGVLVSVAQVLTSIQDATLAYVIRLGAVGFVFLLLGRWMLNVMVQYTSHLWERIPELIG